MFRPEYTKISRRFLPLASFLFLLISATLFRISNSSIGAWSGGGILFGQSRGIRADEYLRATPMLLQYLNDAEPTPLALASYHLIGLPSESWLSNLLRPEYLLSKTIFQNKEMGFSFLQILSVLTFTYLFYYWFRRMSISPMNSVISTGLILFLPVMQWWSLSFIAIVGNALLSSLLLHKYLTSTTILQRYLYFSLLQICILRTLTGYPIWAIISLGTILPLEFINYMRVKNLRFSSKVVQIHLLKIVSTFCLFFLFYYLVFKSQYTILLNTVYPGQRRGGGTQEPFENLFSFPINFLLPLSNEELPISNRSEVAGGALIFLIPILSILVMWWLKVISIQNKRTIVFLVILNFSLVSWCTFDWPTWSSRLPLISQMTPSRVLQSLGFTLVLFFVFLLNSRVWNIRIKHISWLEVNLSVRLLKGFLAFFCFTAIGFLSLRSSQKFNSVYFSSQYSNFIVVVSVMLFAVLLSILVISDKTWLKFLLLGTFVFSTMAVNPVQQGLGQFNSPIFKEILRNNLDSGFFAVGTGAQEDAILQLNGFPVLGGNQMAGPNFEYWEKLDPKRLFQDRWNRAGTYVIFSPSKGDLRVENPTQDQILLRYDPCWKNVLIDRIGLVVSTQAQDFECLKLLYSIPANGINLNFYSRVIR